MPFQYACFISYRRTNQSILDRFVKDLSEGLSFELAPYLDLGVFTDPDPGVQGETLEAAITTALCRSVCMVPVYTPNYFSTAHTFSAREFRLMQELEKQRLGTLERDEERRQGLIIPVVLRGADLLPGELRNRQFYSFEQYMLGDRRVFRSPGFRKSLEKIARYIFDCYRSLRPLEAKSDLGCGNLKLPPEESIREWLAGITAPPPAFPLRKEGPR
jgi:hypothetical protein